jgi:hypothetical protein
MTELTPRQILDAIRRGLEETARRFADTGSDQTRRPLPPRESTDNMSEQDSQTRQQA